MAKLSSASIRLVQKMNRQNKNGEYPIYIVVCFKGRLEKATGVSCLPRHSRASNYFNTEGATIAGLASMLARSSNTIATYAHHLKKDEDLAEIDDVCPI